MTDVSLTWTDERVELLRKLWTDGLSASQIATELGNVTRNAVIGKVHRLGLSGREKDKAAAAQRPRKAARAPSAPVAIPPQNRSNVVLAPVPRPAVVHEAPVLPVEDDEIGVPVSERVTIMELRESMCRWPMGDPTKAEFRFCGARSIGGLPYCDHHARIAYQPVADRKRERKFARG
ncbi:GcrA family cell cycle regulator [Microvirga antarctica]|uniref:GcrA family cell cycle regulator n=1 Tax=Microvirga antarctica TaxID=2819233 RepID=UPI001B304E9C|nr:GcrA family cell cycle regulator [Microvirga antarctica]